MYADETNEYIPMQQSNVTRGNCRVYADVARDLYGHGKSWGKVSFSLRSGNVRESQAGFIRSGKVRGKYPFH